VQEHLALRHLRPKVSSGVHHLVEIDAGQVNLNRMAVITGSLRPSTDEGIALDAEALALCPLCGSTVTGGKLVHYINGLCEALRIC